MTRAAGTWLCALMLSACVATWTLTGDQTAHVGRFLATFALAFAAYLGALHFSKGLDPAALRFTLVMAVVWRAALVLTPPLLSDDVHRYVWEGRIQLHGGNPYVWEDRPEGTRWIPLRDETWRAVSHKSYSALYPPAWQLAAVVPVWIHDSVTTMKAFLVACELAAMVTLAWILRRRGLPPERLLVLAWSPLALVEIAGSGHNDAFAILATVVALAALDSGRPLVAGIAAAVAFDGKILPGFIAAAWARRFRWWHVAIAIVVAGALFIPYAAAGSGLWHSAVRYAHFWRFNESLFAALRAALGDANAMAASTVLLAVVVAAIAWRRTETATGGLIVVAASLLLAANVLPWYALWLLPFLVLRDSPAALLFTGTVTLAYVAYPGWRSGEPWQVSWWVRALEYGPCAAVAWMSRPRGAR